MPTEEVTNAEEIEQILADHAGRSRDDLIPILQEIQDTCGYLSREAVTSVGRYLNLPASKIYGVATFYNQFRFEPLGRYHIQVCRGTACHVKGSAGVMDMVINEIGVQPGQTSRDRLFSLEVVACMGACGLAPVICVNGEFHAKMTPRKLAQLVAEIRQKESSNAE